MRVATFNLFQYVAPPAYWYAREERNTYTIAEWTEKQAWILQQLGTMNADIVGFQEVFSHLELEKLCKQAGYPYFALMETADSSPLDDTVYTRPVVAFASRLPMLNLRTPEIDNDVRVELGLDAEFRFSRLPVCVDVNVPNIGIVTVYVVHLKSKRAITLDVTYLEQVSWEERSQDTLMRVSRAMVTSALQRGAEATLLYHSVSRTLHQFPHRPIVVVGDLNDDPHSTPFSVLTMQERIHSIGGIESALWAENTLNYLHDYRLNDSFRIAPNMRQTPRPFTHLHRGTGTCLDHILVSNALNALNASAVAEVLHYRVWNQHLEDEVHNRVQSDHGQVLIELVPTRAPVREKTYQFNPLSKIATRQDFIDLAGGVYQSDKHYQQWSSQQKWQQFWAFFFDSAYGWVPSIYGSVTVSELHQKQRHSIEHIIPIDFLDRYLTLHHVPRHVRYGATTNPFNFAPSERGLNAKRSNFPFDLDGDNVVRPFNLELHPEAFSCTGFDADNEWVIPSRNRGDVARSILYMLLVYGIDELYQRHIDTLIHWAKVDSPSAWELAYNEWVYHRLGIRNPLIDTPQKTLLLLNNRELMHSMQVDKA